MKIATIRRLTIGLGVLLVLVGLAFNTGTGTLSSFGYQYIAEICPLGALETFLAAKMFIPRTVIAFLLMIAGVVLLGRAFCSWLCPVPPIRRFFHPANKKKAVRPTQAADKTGGQVESATVAAAATVAATAATATAAATAAAAAATAAAASESATATPPEPAAAAPSLRPARHFRLRPAKAYSGCGETCGETRAKFDSRHIVLGGTLISTALFGFPVFCLVCPVGLTFATIIALWRLVGFSEPTLSLIVFPAILLIELVVMRKWCRNLCPLGALYSLLSIANRTLRPKVDPAKCLRSTKGVNCSICTRACEEDLDPHFAAGINNCTKCGSCKDKCPAKAISFPLISRKTDYLPAGSDARDLCDSRDHNS
jgi:ferredoxin-type protein NapH